MRFVEINELPEKERRHLPKTEDRNHLNELLQEFMDMNVKFAEAVLEEGEYVTPYSARTVVSYACNYYRYPIWVQTINGRVYLIRSDM